MRALLFILSFLTVSNHVLTQDGALNHSSPDVPNPIAKIQDENLYVIKNEGNLIPFDKLNRHIRSVSFIQGNSSLGEKLSLFAHVDTINKNAKPNQEYSSYGPLDFNDILIVSYSPSPADSIDQYLDDLQFLNRSHKEFVVVVLYGPTSYLEYIPMQNIDALVHCPSFNEKSVSASAHLLFGAIGTNTNKSSKLTLTTEANGRLSFSSLEEAEISTQSFKKIDEIALNGIKEGAFPGCQVVVAVKDSIVFRKSYGTHTYEQDSKKVHNDDVYDIASITKIAASTMIAMYLEYRNMLDIDDTLGKYISDVTGNSPFSKIKIREMLAHQSGLKSWIPFYIKTMSQGQLKQSLYRSKPDSIYNIKVAENMYLKNDYPNVMYDRILSTSLGSKKYKYSDLCYYFTQKVFESILNEKQEDFVHEMIYEPLGLRNIRYLPLNYFDKEKIVPTEHDTLFRKQLIHGHVHDPGAAMLGGVGGHAGIFSNATDLASIMQIFLKNGDYGGQILFDESIRKDYTRKQYENNRRGAGFDRPRSKGGGTCDILASNESFGHSGFTGTLAWADPENDIIFVFLSNRVHPDQENWKIRDMNIRTDIQHVIYQALGIK
jgi:beta-N-acetylhexosaminidase